ncbi:MAG: hypothetical protein ACRC92_21605 [Peptostreptococcaceae bacterium]
MLKMFKVDKEINKNKTFKIKKAIKLKLSVLGLSMIAIILNIVVVLLEKQPKTALFLLASLPVLFAQYGLTLVNFKALNTREKIYNKQKELLKEDLFKPTKFEEGVFKFFKEFYGVFCFIVDNKDGTKALIVNGYQIDVIKIEEDFKYEYIIVSDVINI